MQSAATKHGNGNGRRDGDNTPIAQQRFCTDAVQARHRLGSMRDYFGRHVMGVDITPPAGESFRLSTKTLLLPGALANLGTSSTMLFERNPSLMRDGNDDVMLSVMSTPSRFQSRRGGDLAIAGGQAVIYSLDNPWRWAHGDVAATSVRIPRAALAARSQAATGDPVQAVSRNTVALHLLQSYVRALFEVDQPLSAASGRLAANHLLDLVAELLQTGRSERRRETRAGIAAARLALMQRDIAQHLDEPTLDVKWLAARHGVTPRYVQMLFEQEGTTFSTYVRAMRLDLAQRLLCDPAHAHRRVGDIALDAGFSDISNFNRAFRQRHGMTPTEARSEAVDRKPR